MNLMGKILTLLIFFMSICFLVIAIMVGAAHRNWKEIATTNKGKADLYKLQLDNARDQSKTIEKQLKAEQVARQLQIAQLQSLLTVAESRRDEKEKELAELLIISQQRLDELRRAENRLAEQDTQVSTLRADNKKLIDDVAAQRKSVVNLTNQLFQSRGSVSSMKQLNDDLTSQLARQIKVMEANGLTENELTAHIPPKVEGVVVQVMDNFIAISLGTDDGVRAGHVIDIYRDGRYVGKASITRAEYNMSAARVNPDFLQTPVEKGDNVTTKL